MPRYGDWQQSLAIPLRALQDELGRVLEQFRAPAALELGPASWSPAIDLIELPEEVRLVADLPGVPADAIDLSLNGLVLTLQGERPAPPAGNGREHALERPTGPFHRQVPLPCEVEIDTVRAEVKDGVLEVVLPKAEALRPRSIPIRSV